jgi:hypothetical protein
MQSEPNVLQLFSQDGFLLCISPLELLPRFDILSLSVVLIIMIFPFAAVLGDIRPPTIGLTTSPSCDVVGESCASSISLLPNIEQSHDEMNVSLLSVVPDESPPKSNVLCEPSGK